MHFRALITGLAHERCVVIASHQTEDIAALCDHVLVLRAGETLFAGPPPQLAASPRDRRQHQRSKTATCSC